MIRRMVRYFARKETRRPGKSAAFIRDLCRRAFHGINPDSSLRFGRDDVRLCILLLAGCLSLTACADDELLGYAVHRLYVRG